MSYDEGLAERLRSVLAEQQGATEKRMFGGLCFLLDGKMCVGIVKDELMVRVGAARDAEALAKKHARPMDFTGRPMRGYVFVAPAGLASDRELEWWVGLGVACARTVTASTPRKPTRPARGKRKPPG